MFEPFTAMTGKTESPALFVSLLFVVQVSPYATAEKSSDTNTTEINICLNLFISYPFLRQSVFSQRYREKTSMFL
jgi:hypothetical protein